MRPNSAEMAMVMAMVVGWGCSLNAKDGGSVVEDGTTSTGTTSGSDGGSGTSGSGADSSGAGGTTAGFEIPAACQGTDWSTSYATYQDAVAEQGDTYHYTIHRYQCVGGGFCEESCGYGTEVEVVDGQVVRRRFSLTSGTSVECTMQGFDEMGAQVGTSDEPLAAPAITFDALYEVCCEEVFVSDSEDSEIHFGTDAAGLLSDCYREFVDCGEGCTEAPEGYGGAIEVETFAFGPLDG